MQISQKLTRGLIQTHLRSTTKTALFEEMVDLLVAEGALTDREAALDSLYERESVMSTGVAPGFALPHGKVAGVSGIAIALGISQEGIEYDSLDGEPVHVVVMLFSEPKNPAPHIEALSEVGRLLTIPGFLEKLQSASDADAVLALLKEEEAVHG